MKVQGNLWLFSLLLALATVCRAETYLNFEPGDTISDAKRKYPNASFVPVEVGWTTRADRFLRMSGQGLAGEVYLKFSSDDEGLRQRHDKFLRKLDSASGQERIDAEVMVDHYTRELAKPDDERMTLDWIRWVPERRLPVERVTARYGKPVTCDYDANTFEPFCNWGTRGITASLSDDKKWVVMFDFQITTEDWNKKLGLNKNKKRPSAESSFQLPEKKKDDKAKPASGKVM